MTRAHLRTIFAPALQAADRTVARATWARQVMAELARVQQLLDQAWDRHLAEHPEDDDDDDDFSPPEQAQLEALLAQINAAIDHDRWPRHLDWGSL